MRCAALGGGPFSKLDSGPWFGCTVPRTICENQGSVASPVFEVLVFRGRTPRWSGERQAGGGFSIRGLLGILRFREGWTSPSAPMEYGASWRWSVIARCRTPRLCVVLYRIRFETQRFRDTKRSPYALGGCSLRQGVIALRGGSPGISSKRLLNSLPFVFRQRRGQQVHLGPDD